jgi:predicted regulator of Ras-like GTPase activity (Roadblock/LC7/MglB family)
MLISKDGTPLFISKEKQKEEEFDQALIGCFLSAIQSFAQEVSKSPINKIEMQANTFYYAAKGPVFSVVVSEDEDVEDSRIYKVTAERVCRAFLNKYSEEVIQKEQGVLDFFEDFNEEYNNIIQEIERMKDQSNKDFILEQFVTAASDENIIGMIIFDLNRDEIIARDIPEYIKDRSFESFSSMLFNFVDRLGSELKEGKINEILMRGKNHWIGGFRRGDLAVFTIFSHDFFGNIIPSFMTSAIDEN